MGQMSSQHHESVVKGNGRHDTFKANRGHDESILEKQRPSPATKQSIPIVLKTHCSLFVSYRICLVIQAIQPRNGQLLPLTSTKM